MSLAEILAAACSEHGAVGAVAAVSAAGELTQAAYGLANQPAGIEATSDTVFALGSVSKVYTATLVMQLVDDGLIDLDQPIVSYVLDFPLAAEITMRHILTHTSGIDGDVFEDFGRGDDCRERLVGFLSTIRPLTEIGEIFSYSNAAFAVAGHVIERVTGATYDHALKTRLAGPLSLERTVTMPDEAVRHRVAFGHFRLGGADPFLAPAFKLSTAQDPAGGIHATASDLLAFARLHLDHGRSTKGEQVVSEVSVALMQSPQLELLDGVSDASVIGLAWSLGRTAGHSYLQHGGLTMGGNALLRVFPDDAIAIGVMCNTHGAPVCADVVREVQRELLDIKEDDASQPDEIETELRSAERYLGIYERHGVRIEVRPGPSGLEAGATGDGMMAVLIAQAVPPWTALRPVGDATFALPAGRVAFLRDEPDGRARFCAFGGRLLRRAD